MKYVIIQEGKEPAKENAAKTREIEKARVERREKGERDYPVF